MKNRFSRSVAKFIRKQKAEIRRKNAGANETDRQISELLNRLAPLKKKL
jgi:hypothetical protein